MDNLWLALSASGITSIEIDQIKHLYLIIFMIPIVVTIIGISRYIFGLSSLKVYIPIITVFAFYELGYRSGQDSGITFVRGLIYGLLLFLFSFIFATLSYKAVQRFKLHYIPKLSLVVTTVSIAIFLLVLIMISFDKNIFISVSPFIIVMMIIISEEFMSVLAKKNFLYTFSITFETLLTAVLSYAIISIDQVQKAIFDKPYIIIGIIVLNILVGKFTGLRINEYWRFRDILFKQEQKNNDKPESADQK